MVKLIVGEKGTGKTKRLVNDLNEMAQISENNVICIQNGDRLNNYIDTSIRLVNIEEYPVSNYSELIAFIAGINAKDYDLTQRLRAFLYSKGFPNELINRYIEEKEE